MSTATDSPPLSATRPHRTTGLSALLDTCSWVDRPHDFAPDTWLAVLLDERCRWLEADRAGHGHGVQRAYRDERHAPELPTVGELPADWLPPLIEDVQARYPRWRLHGGEAALLIERLDAHFRRRQAARTAEVAAREARDADETRWREEAEQDTDRLAVERDRALYGIESEPD
jgi:hypothetical protein